MQVPQIKRDLEELTESLTDLADTLPTIQSQIFDIKDAYDSGRDKVHHHVIRDRSVVHMTLGASPCRGPRMA